MGCGANQTCDAGGVPACVCTPGYTLSGGGACVIVAASIAPPRPVAPLSTVSVDDEQSTSAGEPAGAALEVTEFSVPSARAGRGAARPSKNRAAHTCADFRRRVRRAWLDFIDRFGPSREADRHHIYTESCSLLSMLIARLAMRHFAFARPALPRKRRRFVSRFCEKRSRHE